MFYDNGLKFECQRCSFCCGHSPGFVYLSKRDFDALRGFYNLSVKEFVEKYCRWADYYYDIQGGSFISERFKYTFDYFVTDW